MSIPSLYVMLLKMTLVNIAVISVKKNEILSNGSTIVKIVVILRLNLIVKTTLNDINDLSVCPM